jgi:hypothetical protein
MQFQLVAPEGLAAERVVAKDGAAGDEHRVCVRFDLLVEQPLPDANTAETSA